MTKVGALPPIVTVIASIDFLSASGGDDDLAALRRMQCTRTHVALQQRACGHSGGYGDRDRRIAPRSNRRGHASDSDTRDGSAACSEAVHRAPKL